MLDANATLPSHTHFGDFLDDCTLFDLHASDPPESTYIGAESRRIDFILGCHHARQNDWKDQERWHTMRVRSQIIAVSMLIFDWTFSPAHWQSLHPRHRQPGTGQQIQRPGHEILYGASYI